MFRNLSRFIFLVLVGICIGGCGAVHPPASAADPIAVYVADYGIHSAVMLPVGPARYVEYAFGDWGYCALDRMGPFDSIGALLFSSGSAIGRRFIEMKPGQDHPTPISPLPKKIFPVYVSRGRLEEVEKKLDRRYRKYECTAVYNSGNDTFYARDDEHYSVFHSCNHLTADTLRQMDCRVDGPVLFSAFHLADGAKASAPPPQPPPASRP